jgi:hypothetical protein
MKLTFNGNEIQCESKMLGNIAALRLSEYTSEDMAGMAVIGNDGAIMDNPPSGMFTEGYPVWCVNLRGRGLISSSLEWAMKCVRNCDKTDSADSDGQDGMN